MGDLRGTAARVAVSLPFRVVLAIGILAFHVAMMSRLARERFGWGFNEAPGAPPAFGDVHELLPHNWDRLIVARWDAQHYEALGLRGYQTCKDKTQLDPGTYPDDDKSCELNFYPTYPWIGRAVMRVTGLPIDWALFVVSLVASFAFILMWTCRQMMDGLGVGNTYLSLLLLNLFSTGYSLVTVQTEPCVMALTIGAFVCLGKRWLVAAAVLAGAATSIRVTGVATGFAFCAAIATLTLREHRRPLRRWLSAGALMALSGWGVMALMAYYFVRFGDPLVYSHAHQRAFHHEAGLAKFLFPDGRMLMQSIWAEPNDGLILAAALLWFALGHREGLAGFVPEARAFWYVLFIGIIGISMYGSTACAYCGSSRYALTALPIFFAMAALMRGRPTLIALWLVMSTTHYYQANACFYEGQLHPDRLHQCSFPRFYRSSDLDAKEQ